MRSRLPVWQAAMSMPWIHGLYLAFGAIALLGAGAAVLFPGVDDPAAAITLALFIGSAVCVLSTVDHCRVMITSERTSLLPSGDRMHRYLLLWQTLAVGCLVPVLGITMLPIPWDEQLSTAGTILIACSALAIASMFTQHSTVTALFVIVGIRYFLPEGPLGKGARSPTLVTGETSIILGAIAFLGVVWCCWQVPRKRTNADSLVMWLRPTDPRRLRRESGPRISLISLITRANTRVEPIDGRAERGFLGEVLRWRMAENPGNSYSRALVLVVVPIAALSAGTAYYGGTIFPKALLAVIGVSVICGPVAILQRRPLGSELLRPASRQRFIATIFGGVFLGIAEWAIVVGIGITIVAKLVPSTAELLASAYGSALVALLPATAAMIWLLRYPKFIRVWQGVFAPAGLLFASLHDWIVISYLWMALVAFLVLLDGYRRWQKADLSR